MKNNIYFSYLNCHKVDKFALKYFNYYCNKIVNPNERFAIWIDKFSKKNHLTMLMCDVWTRIFMKGHILRYKLNAAMAIIECRQNLFVNTFFKKNETNFIAIIFDVSKFFIVFTISLFIITPIKFIFFVTRILSNN